MDLHGIRRRLELFTYTLKKWARQRRSLGARGERVAAKYLRRRGYHLIHRQAKNLYGEIDIIAVDSQTVVFVEVKTRSSHAAGHPADAVTLDKQRRLTRIALAYLRYNDLLENSARFDVIAVTWPPGKRKPDIVHYRNAFEPVDKFQMFS